jgi:hypothetical protein
MRSGREHIEAALANAASVTGSMHKDDSQPLLKQRLGFMAQTFEAFSGRIESHCVFLKLSHQFLGHIDQFACNKFVERLDWA